MGKLWRLNELYVGLYEEDIKAILLYLPKNLSDTMGKFVTYKRFSYYLHRKGFNVKHLLKLARISSNKLDQQ